MVSVTATSLDHTASKDWMNVQITAFIGWYWRSGGVLFLHLQVWTWNMLLRKVGINFQLFLLFTSCCVSILITVHIFTVNATLFLFAVHVSTIKGHDQVVSISNSITSDM
jgi:hypothetical protein